MIVLNVIYKCKPGKRDAFLNAIKEEGIDSASRAEAGNIKYDYYLSADDRDELLLVEKWKDAEAVTEHGRKVHYARLGELKTSFVDDTIIERFDS